MNHNLIQALDVACSYQDMINIQQKLCEIIDQEKDLNMKRIIIYACDDKLISRFNNAWLPYLIEKLYFKTDSGGTKFYNYINEYIAEKNHLMILACSMILKNGFCGRFIKWPADIYNSLLQMLNVNISSPKIYVPYIPHRKYNKPINLWWVVLPILLVYLILYIGELFVFKKITTLLQGGII